MKPSREEIFRSCNIDRWEESEDNEWKKKKCFYITENEELTDYEYDNKI